MTLFARIRELAGTVGGRALLSRFTGLNFTGADWQAAFDQASDRTVRLFVVWLEEHAPDRWTLLPGESLVQWMARKRAAQAAAERALLDQLDDLSVVMECA